MSRRKKKQENLLIGPILFVIIFIFYSTRSIELLVISIVATFLIIIVVTLVKQKKQSEKLKRSGINEVDKMDGIQFEYYLSTLFTNFGYTVKVTQATGDYGADLVLIKGQEKTVVQAKRYNSNVGIKAVQEISAAKSYYQAANAWVVTNSYFTNPAIELAKSNKVRLISRDTLIEMMLQLNPVIEKDTTPLNETAATILKNNEMLIYKEINKDYKDAIISCPRCKAEMVLRKGKKGSFYGCSTFPKCRGTKVLQ